MARITEFRRFESNQGTVEVADADGTVHVARLGVASRLDATSPQSLTALDVEAATVDVVPRGALTSKPVLWVDTDVERLEGDGLSLVWSRPVLFVMRAGVVVAGPVWWPKVRTRPFVDGVQELSIAGESTWWAPDAPVSWVAGRAKAQAGCGSCGGRGRR